MTKNSETKNIQISQHGNYLYGTLDGLDFVPSGTIPETRKPYSASIRLKFIMKSFTFKDLNGVKIPVTRALSVVVRLATTDEELPNLVSKYNSLVGKDLLINYNCKDGDVLNIQDENEIIEIK